MNKVFVIYLHYGNVGREVGMTVVRYLKGRIYFSRHPWQSWHHFSLESYWGGRLLYMNFSKFSLQLDVRGEFMSEMLGTAD